MSRVHHDDEGRVFFRDTEGQVWRVTVRSAPPERRVDFRAVNGASLSYPYDGSRGEDDLADAEIADLFRRARSGRRSSRG